MQRSGPRHVLAVDIGGTKVAVGVVSRDGEILARGQAPTAAAATGEELFGTVVELASDAMSAVDEAPTICGVGTGGPAREMHRLISPLNIAVWRDFPLGERLSRELGLPTHVENDAKALALGEGWLGGARGETDYIAMVVSTGVGGGIVLEGRLLHGADGNAGHVGHVFVEPDGRADASGARGNLEGQASGTAIRAVTGADPATAPVEVRRHVGELVGRGIASVANLLDLRLALVSGSVALGYGDDFFDAAQRTVDQLCRLDHSRGTVVRPGELGADGPLIGAAAVALRAAGMKILPAD
ncbi:MAG: ROK family protein [Acidimicrobiales bacterium]